MRGLRAFALRMGTRTGKTFTVLTDFAVTHLDLRDADDLLVVAPASYYEAWEGALERDLHPSLYRQVCVLVWRASSTTLFDVSAFLRTRSPRVLVVDVEALATVDRARDLVLAYASQRRCYCAVDESTTIKNPAARAKQSNFVVKQLGPLCWYRRVLTGLMAPRSPEDLYQQFAFLDPSIIGLPSFRAFQGRYCVLKKTYFKTGTRREVLRFRNLDHLQAVTEPWSYSVELDASRVYERAPVDLTPEQRRVYDELVEAASAELSAESRVTVHQVITQILRLHQVACGHVRDDDGVVHDLPENRTRAVVDAASQLGGKVVVWVAFAPDVGKVRDALDRAHGAGSTSVFWGGNRRDRLREEELFLQEASRRFMVATPAAGKFGREWRVASGAVYHSNTDNLEDRVQSEARVLAFDKDEPATYLDVVAAGTVDERIIKNLVRKSLLAAEVDGRRWREWVR
jgi:hypothetical protein